jgi:hypothetical protein
METALAAVGAATASIYLNIGFVVTGLRSALENMPVMVYLDLVSHLVEKERAISNLLVLKWLERE